MLFDQYRGSPEYLKLKTGMSLAAFKEIFWWEYIHRVWGRLIGLAFLLPFIWFAWTGRLERSIWPRLALLFVLGGLEGALGWWMVKSGLADDPYVSQYRLAAHLGLAILIYGALLWTAFGLAQPHAVKPPSAPRLRRAAWLLVALVFTTIISGAFVAGLDAGTIMNTFPLMDGRLVPEDYWLIEPPVWNLFENPIAVQFDHRLLASITVLAAIALWLATRSAGATDGAKRQASLMLLVVLVQAGLGIATLLTMVPISLGALHQAGAVLLLTFTLWTAHELYRPAPPAVARREPAKAAGTAGPAPSQPAASAASSGTVPDGLPQPTA